METVKSYRKFGKWSVELVADERSKAQIVVTDGWKTDYPMFYEELNRPVAFDNPYALPKAVKEWVNKNQNKLVKERNELRAKQGFY